MDADREKGRFKDPPHLCDPECDLSRFLAAQMADVRQRSCDIVRYNRRGHRHRPCLVFPQKEHTELNAKLPAENSAGSFLLSLVLQQFRQFLPISQQVQRLQFEIKSIAYYIITTYILYVEFFL